MELYLNIVKKKKYRPSIFEHVLPLLPLGTSLKVHHSSPKNSSTKISTTWDSITVKPLREGGLSCLGTRELTLVQEGADQWQSNSKGPGADAAGNGYKNIQIHWKTGPVLTRP